MNKMSHVKKSIICAICIALCVVLPMGFHSIQNAGSIFLPMHIPVLLCGLMCGWPFGLLCGIVGPLLSSLLTAMPPFAYLPNMMIELAAYGALTGIMMRLLNTGKLYLDLYISLLTALLAGRVIAGAAKALIFAPGSYSMTAWITGYFITGFPGLIIQIILVPSIVFALEKGQWGRS